MKVERSYSESESSFFPNHLAFSINQRLPWVNRQVVICKAESNHAVDTGLPVLLLSRCWPGFHSLEMHWHWGIGGDVFFFSLKYSCCTILYKLQLDNIVIHNFLKLYSVYSYYKILAIFPIVYNISLHIISYIIVCTS